MIALRMRYVGDTRRFASFEQTNEKAFMLPVFGHKYFGHKYFELNVVDFLFISETNLSSIVVLKRCSKMLIKC